MIAQLFLSALLALVSLYVWFASKRARPIGFVVITICLAGAFFVWQPGAANWLARVIGIGRGADLVFYIWVIVSLLAIVNLHLTIRGQSDVMTALAREMAMQNAKPAKDDRAADLP